MDSEKPASPVMDVKPPQSTPAPAAQATPPVAPAPPEAPKPAGHASEPAPGKKPKATVPKPAKQKSSVPVGIISFAFIVFLALAALGYYAYTKSK